MLLFLRTQGIGPAPRFDLSLGTRLNVLTGDNGLGKSFVLDLAWYAMTGTWAGQPALPRADARGTASIRWKLRLRSGKTTRKESRWEAKKRSWGWPGGKPPMAGLTLYARVDGGFSVWDPARNYWRNAKRWASTLPIGQTPTTSAPMSYGTACAILTGRASAAG